MVEKIILGFIGEIGGGKTVMAELLRKHNGAYAVSTGDLVRAELIAEGIKNPSREACQKRGGERGREDKNYWTNKVIEAFEASSASICVFDGVRFKHDITNLKERFGDKYIVIHFVAPQETRYNRLVERGRADAPRTLDDIAAQDRGEEAAFDLSNTVKLADLEFDNTEQFDFYTDEGKMKLYTKFINFLKSNGVLGP